MRSSVLILNCIEIGILSQGGLGVFWSSLCCQKKSIYEDTCICINKENLLKCHSWRLQNLKDTVLIAFYLSGWLLITFCISASQASFLGLVRLQMDNQCFKKQLPKETKTAKLIADKSEECWLQKEWEGWESESWESVNLLSCLNQGKE